jgi:hypothetical protein
MSRVVEALLVALLLPLPLTAQDVAHFEALSTPPENVGTCIPLPNDTSARAGRRLVMKSIPPGRSREMWVRLTAGSISYSEHNFITRGGASGRGATIIAILDSTGSVRLGRRTDADITPADTIVPRDLASVNAMKMTTTGDSRGLEQDEIAKVRELVAFVRKRCSI